jgi:hypothetical protein
MPPVPARKPTPQWTARTTKPTGHYDCPVRYGREHKSAANWINDIMVECRDG